MKTKREVNGAEVNTAAGPEFRFVDVRIPVPEVHEVLVDRQLQTGIPVDVTSEVVGSSTSGDRREAVITARCSQPHR